MYLDVREELGGAVIINVDGPNQPAEVIMGMIVQRVDAVHEIVA